MPIGRSIAGLGRFTTRKSKEASLLTTEQTGTFRWATAAFCLMLEATVAFLEKNNSPD